MILYIELYIPMDSSDSLTILLCSVILILILYPNILNSTRKVITPTPKPVVAAPAQAPVHRSFVVSPNQFNPVRTANGSVIDSGGRILSLPKHSPIIH